jgi:hypothetical protein
MTGARTETDDLRLWITTAGCPERDYLWGNPHTFPGRIEVYCPHQGRNFAVSTFEIVECAPETQIWIAGYLRGNEPEPPEDDDLLPVWLAQIGEFHDTGIWPQAD